MPKPPRRSMRLGPPTSIFKQIQSDHPTAENLIPEVTKRLDAVKKFVSDRKLVTIPAEAETVVKETPPDRRATSFASMDTPGPFEKRANESLFLCHSAGERLARAAEGTMAHVVQLLHDAISSRSTKYTPAITCSFCI